MTKFVSKFKFAPALGLVAAAMTLASCNPDAGSVRQITTNGDARIFQPKNIKGSDLGLTGSKTLVLTFDDGPFNGVTDDVLNTLAAEGIRANFFLEGDHIAGNEHLLARMANEGHEVGNHTFDHTGLIGLGKKSMDLVYDELHHTDLLIAPYVSASQRFYFRAPGGSWTPNHTNEMNARFDLQKYIGPVYWDVGGTLAFMQANGRHAPKPNGAIYTSADWNCWTAKVSVQQCAQGYLNESIRKQGGIVLMHDRDKRTAQMIKILIPEWKRLGYKFITLDQIQGIEKLQ